ncbi:hypothetical protein CEXT_460911 [Caerostris extrusa]|uniref:Ycf2 n=1 Tax=Caerostris extrusa TaxID=172846 RepID=A0AAV4MUM0_CAEEX|nr:hypothetical protein CEXT_460911 [Caerostris extrusa]
MLPSDKVLSSMNIPQLLMENLIVYVRYIAVECREWISVHAMYLEGYALDQFPNIHWRWDGRIDRQKTAEAILRAGSASIEHRFRLACGYCFKEDILSLWNEMSEEQREKESQKSLTSRWIQWILHEERDGWPKSSEDPIFRDLLYEPLLNSVGVRTSGIPSTSRKTSLSGGISKRQRMFSINLHCEQYRFALRPVLGRNFWNF